MRGTRIDVTSAAIDLRRSALHLRYERGHFIDEAIDARAHDPQEAALTGRGNSPFEIAFEHRLEDGLHLALDGGLLGPVGPFDHGADALPRSREHGIRIGAERPRA